MGLSILYVIIILIDPILVNKLKIDGIVFSFMILLNIEVTQLRFQNRSLIFRFS